MAIELAMVTSDFKIAYQSYGNISPILGKESLNHSYTKFFAYSVLFLDWELDILSVESHCVHLVLGPHFLSEPSNL